MKNLVFISTEDAVDVICNRHGAFSIRAASFSSGKGCPKCGSESGGNKNRLTNEEFIRNALLIHGNRYDYSLVEYVSAKHTITIVCKIHGLFNMTPTNHLGGKGCKKCGIVKSAIKRRLDQDEVIKRFKRRHGDTYDYSNTIYTGDAHAKLDIMCKDHGLFHQSYANHNAGKGCPICANEITARFKSGFIERSISNNNASVYLIKCENDVESFFKIGITTKTISRRFSGETSMPYRYELLHNYHSSGDEVWNLEKRLHRYYKDVKYVPKITFGGMYECFSNIKLEEYVEVLNNIVESFYKEKE